MVRIASAITLAAMVSSTIAAPSALNSLQELDARETGFTFEKWINGIIADPEGDHLSPDEAVAAAQEAASKQEGLAKRDSVSCNDKGKPRASLSDASTAISKLAARGGNCHIPYAGGAQLSVYGLAEIYGVTVNKAGSILPCNTFAQSAGRILDLCVHPGDTTVQGSNHPNGNIQIHITQP